MTKQKDMYFWVSWWCFFGQTWQFVSPVTPCDFYMFSKKCKSEKTQQKNVRLLCFFARAKSSRIGDAFGIRSFCVQLRSFCVQVRSGVRKIYVKFTQKSSRIWPTQMLSVLQQWVLLNPTIRAHNAFRWHYRISIRNLRLSIVRYLPG